MIKKVEDKTHSFWVEFFGRICLNFVIEYLSQEIPIHHSKVGKHWRTTQLVICNYFRVKTHQPFFLLLSRATFDFTPKEPRLSVAQIKSCNERSFFRFACEMTLGAPNRRLSSPLLLGRSEKWP